MDRSKELTTLRPNIITSNSEMTTPQEIFQNNTLRPILKFQNDLFIYLFRQSTMIQKSNFDKKTDFDKKGLITDALKKDQKLKDAMVTSVISLMTIEELDDFYASKSEHQKRIISMIIERLMDQMI